jgi:putative serine/threonine protein kinase
VPVEELAQNPYLAVLCYPTLDKEVAAARIRELRTLGVEALNFEGRSQIGRLKILGKGCVSVVVKARTSTDEYALKIRRVDANRISMQREADLQLIANKAGVGPRLYASSENLLLMEVVEGIGVVEWVKNLKGRGSVQRLRDVVRVIFDQCYRLDQVGLDHGELSNLSKHVYVDGKVAIIDFETASANRRVRNLTSAVQYLFIGGPTSKRILRLLNLSDLAQIMGALRDYKTAKDLGSYKRILACLKLERRRKKEEDMRLDSVDLSFLF